MLKRVLAMGLFLGAAFSATPALADFSACGSALVATVPQEEIRLYTICITKGGMPVQDRAGAYNNRGNAYLREGEPDRAFEDLTRAIESDPRRGTGYLREQVRAVEGPRRRAGPALLRPRPPSPPTG